MPRQPIDTALSNTALSNLFTMGVAAANDPRQRVPEQYGIPEGPTRVLRARLCVEEVLELAEGLGFVVYFKTPLATEQAEVEESARYAKADMDGIKLVAGPAPDIDKIIDAVCDLIYVATGTMLVCGAPDNPHLEAVNRANNAKFPGGKAITDANGKFQKPPGWQAPNHGAARCLVNLAHLTEAILRGGPTHGAGASIPTPDNPAADAFKAYVHKRLDEMGVPTHIDGPHSKEGCRVGDRLDWLEGKAGLRAVRPLPGTAEAHAAATDMARGNVTISEQATKSE